MARRRGTVAAHRDDRLLAWLAVGFGELLAGVAIAIAKLIVPALYPSLAFDISTACAVAAALLAVIAAAATAWLAWRR